MRIYEIYYTKKRFCGWDVDRTHYDDLSLLSSRALDQGGTSLIPHWTAPIVQWIQKPGIKPLPILDLLTFNRYGVLLLSDRARAVLEPVLRGAGDFLPIHCPQGTYHAFQVTRIVDALDSQFARFDGGPGSHALGAPRISRVYIYAFLQERLENVPIFMVKHHDSVLVGEEFVQLAKAKRLKTFDFRLVWDSEDASFRDERWHPTQWQVIRSTYQVRKEDLM